MWHHLCARFNSVKLRILHPGIAPHQTVPILRGLPEGSRLSPTLCRIFAADLVNHLKRKFPEATILHNNQHLWVGGYCQQQHVLGDETHIFLRCPATASLLDEITRQITRKLRLFDAPPWTSFTDTQRLGILLGNPPSSLLKKHTQQWTQECVPLLHTYVVKLRALLETLRSPLPPESEDEPPITRERAVGLDEDERRREIRNHSNQRKSPQIRMYTHVNMYEKLRAGVRGNLEGTVAENSVPQMGS